MASPSTSDTQITPGSCRATECCRGNAPGLFCTALVAMLSVSLTACTPWHTMAIYDLPRSFTLNPLPDRHFRLSMNVLLSGQARTIEYDWSCTQEKVFSEN